MTESILEISRSVLVILHFVGVAALLGGFITQMKAIMRGNGRIVAAMVHGGWTMLATGIALVGVAQWRIALGAGFEVDNAKIGVKTLVIVTIMALILAYRKRETVKPAVMLTIGVLTLANIVVAVVW